MSSLTEATSTRKYFSFDVFVNGKSIGFLDNFEGVDLPEDYTTTNLLLGEFSKNYPTSKIFAITPIWRKDCNEKVAFGLFADAENDILKIAENFENVSVISGSELVPKDERYYADSRLHPNDEGFDFYAENVCSKLKLEL